MKEYITKHPGILHGCDYNPEQWIGYPEILRQDIEYMKKAHISVVSLGIFSWAHLEPEEGVYNFEFFDKIISDLTSNGIKIVLATPSGARPRWLAQKYPEVMRVGSDGRRPLYSRRHNHCYTSPVMREKITKLDREIAKHYANNENVVLWHISNEFLGECYCDLCQAQFRKWLKKKYNNDLKKLNHAWWSHFWSHTVTDWEQIHSPIKSGENFSTLPGLTLDWLEFASYQTADFMNAEIEAVHSVNPNIPVTTNLYDVEFHTLDHNYVKNFVDIMSLDAYPDWHSLNDDISVAVKAAFTYDMFRSLKNKPFFLMESVPSCVNWRDFNKLKNPGMHKLSCIQAVAHGADSIQYFQWRKGRGGVEKFHGAIVDHNCKSDTRVFKDVTEVGEILEAISEIAGTATVSEAAILYDYRNKWAINSCVAFCNEDKKYDKTCIKHYAELWKRGINADIAGFDSDLSRYKLIIMPMMYSISEGNINKLEEYVANGGCLVATYLTGYANETDLCNLGGFPGGKLRDVFGLTADETDSMRSEYGTKIKMGSDTYEAHDFCELISPTTANALAFYDTDFYKGTPAILENSYGKGKAWYIACRSDSVLPVLYEKIIEHAKISAHALPSGVSLHSRNDGNNEYVFIQNFTNEYKKISLKETYTDMLSGKKCSGDLKLGAYDVRILKGNII